MGSCFLALCAAAALAVFDLSAFARAAVGSDTPTVAGCPVAAVVGDGSDSTFERAPSANDLYGRAVWLIPAAEAAANGLLNGTVPNAIGFRYSTAPGVVATGSLKVYLQNTGDTGNLKPTNWASAIAGMTLVHDSASTTLPDTTASFDIAFTGGSPFTYTGGGLYVAFDWSWPGPATGEAVVACNSTGLVGGLLGAQSSSGPPGTISPGSYRPETRLTPSAATVFNDASVDAVMSLGSLPQPLVGPQTVKAVITNRGANALTDLPVTLNVSGAQTFTNTQVVAGPLAACGGSITVKFAPFTPSAIGSNTVAVSIPADEVASNNAASRPLDATFNVYSYKYPGTTSSGGVGVDSPYTADFVAKFATTTAVKVTAVNLEFFAASATTYRVAIYPDSGSGTPGLVPLYEDAADRTVVASGPVTIALPAPVPVGPGAFFAGIQQTNTTNASLGFDEETPIRPEAFFMAVPHPATGWSDFAPGRGFKLNIGVTLQQCAGDAECSDVNACTADVCENSVCVHVNVNASSCDGNACSNPDQCVDGTCIPGPNPCDDNDACTSDYCGGPRGCSHIAVDCKDANPCTNDFCDPATGCGHSDNTDSCSDGDPCTIGDACSGGACAPGTAALPSPARFCNHGAIAIPSAGAASPYPSAITVTGQPSYLCSATLDLEGIAHTYPDDIDVLLARLAGANAIVMSDVGGGTAIAGVNLTLSDAAVASLPNAGPLESGTFKPTNAGGSGTEAWPAPAPAPTGGSALAAFIGTNPNGAWNVFVVDDESPDSGSIGGGWCLNLVSVCTASADCEDGNPCTDDSCAGGLCSHADNTSPCDDANACTDGDTCRGGACAGGPPPACDDGNACTANLCNAQTGQCENPAIACDDANACTDDGCNPATGCVHAPNDANACTDGNLCTSPDSCHDGVCVGENPVTCPPDANVCTTEVCDPATGQCVSTDNTNACDDGDVCTLGDTCGPSLDETFDGEVAPSLPGTWSSAASGGNPWTTVSGDADTPPNSAFGYDGPTVADEVLVSPPIHIASASARLTFRNRWSFEKLSACFDAGVLEIDIAGGGFTDIVAAGGSFVSGGYTGTVSSSFSNPLAGRPAWCYDSEGYPAYLTTVVNLPAAAAGQLIQLQWRIGTDTTTGAPGQNIDSIVLLDGTHVCNPGVGTLDCNDANPCTDDSCDPALGCRYADNADPCDDADACTILDTCAEGACAGTTIACDDGNACTDDRCDTGSGCVFAPNTSACDDGNPCTTGDVCGGGVCSGAVITAPPETRNLTAAADKATYTWSSAAFATRYDVVRGGTAALPVGPGGGDEACFDDLAGASVSDPAIPAPHTAFWYLSRGENACGIGTYGVQGVRGAPGAPRTSTTCP